MTNLVDIIEYVKPTALLGLSTTKSAFTQAVIEKVMNVQKWLEDHIVRQSERPKNVDSVLQVRKLAREVALVVPTR